MNKRKNRDDDNSNNLINDWDSLWGLSSNFNDNNINFISRSLRSKEDLCLEALNGKSNYNLYFFYFL
jgi:hypothetical protein